MLVRASPAIIPLFDMPVPAGFPSPAADFTEQAIDLSELLIRNKAATFMVRFSGQSMIEVGILDGSLGLVDRSEQLTDGRIVMASLNGEYTVKRLRRRGGRIFLEAANQEYQPIEVSEEADLIVFGVVTYVINKLIP